MIGVSSTEEFDNDRVCEVTMKMGGESKVIARLVRPSKEKHLTVYAAVVKDGEVQFNETGDSYLYETEEAESLDMIWTGCFSGYSSLIGTLVRPRFENSAKY